MEFNKEEFFQAVVDNDILKISFFAHLGAKINYLDPQGRTAIHIAIEHGYTDLVGILMDMGGNPYISNLRGEHALTIPMDMSPETCLTVLKELLDLGLNPNKANALGRTPLQKAILKGNTDAILLLLKYKANMLQSSSMYSPFFMLVSPDYDFPGREEMLNKVLTGLDMRQQDDTGSTILHVAVSTMSQKDLVFKLLKRGADPNIQNTDGNTPLHLCVTEFDTRSMLPILLGHGANPYLRNNDGDNCFNILRKKSEYGLLSLLKEYAKKHGLREKYASKTT